MLCRALFRQDRKNFMVRDRSVTHCGWDHDLSFSNGISCMALLVTASEVGMIGPTLTSFWILIYYVIGLKSCKHGLEA